MRALALFLLAPGLRAQEGPALGEGRGLYVWSEAKAIAEGDPEEPPKLLSFAAERKVSRLYFMFSGKPTAPLRAFVRQAREAKLEIHALHPGDMDDWLDGFPLKVNPAPIVEWTRAAAGCGLFQGVHLDIEPHASPHWKRHRVELAKAYLELLKLVRAEVKAPILLSAAVPPNWDQDDLKIGDKLLIEHAQDTLDYVSVMGYRGRNVEKVVLALAQAAAYKPARVELIQETDPRAVEDGVPLHVGTGERLEAIFKAAREKYGGRLGLAVHHYTTWRALPP